MVLHCFANQRTFRNWRRFFCAKNCQRRRQIGPCEFSIISPPPSGFNVAIWATMTLNSISQRFYFPHFVIGTTRRISTLVNYRIVKKFAKKETTTIKRQSRAGGRGEKRYVFSFFLSLSLSPMHWGAIREITRWMAWLFSIRPLKKLAERKLRGRKKESRSEETMRPQKKRFNFHYFGVAIIKTILVC